MRRTKEVEEMLATKYKSLSPVLDERALRWWAASEAQALGRGGITAVSVATGMARETIRNGCAELGQEEPGERLRRRGGGRKRLRDKDPGLMTALEKLVDPVTRGDPRSPLRWTCKSADTLAKTLREEGHEVSASTVGRLLWEMGYSLQSVQKTKEGAQQPDRDAQFEHINGMAEDFQRRGEPVVSVDTKKKELVGEFKNAGREQQPAGRPESALVHDFPSDAVGKAIPYGVFDTARNEAWVSVGNDHDTPSFAVDAIRQWWRTMGRRAYPSATELLVTADAGGSNGYRLRVWKTELQRFADSTGLRIHVCHFPPGTSKWNKIEHRLFCQITRNWRGRPLTSFDTIVSLIGATRTESGLRVKAGLNEEKYPTGVTVSDADMAELNIERSDFHGDWNYALIARKRSI